MLRQLRGRELVQLIKKVLIDDELRLARGGGRVDRRAIRLRVAKVRTVMGLGFFYRETILTRPHAASVKSARPSSPSESDALREALTCPSHLLRNSGFRLFLKHDVSYVRSLQEGQLPSAKAHVSCRAFLRGAIVQLHAAGMGGDTSALYAARRVALAYVNEVRPDTTPSDEGFAVLQRHFDERHIVELTWLASFTGYLNGMAKALGIGSDGFCSTQ